MRKTLIRVDPFFPSDLHNSLIDNLFPKRAYVLSASEFLDLLDSLSPARP